MAEYAKIFKAYDIRGTVPDELDESVAEAVGAAFVRLPDGPAEEPVDDLEALANAVMEATTNTPGEPVGQGVEIGRRGHLRVLRSSPQDTGRLR